MLRCWWVGTHEEYRKYHDEEWGVFPSDDREFFEKLCLECFQSGLSWLTVLLKRSRLRDVFHQFNFSRVAKMNREDVERLMNDNSIIRHKGKIEAVISNANHAVRLVKEFGSLEAYFTKFSPPQEERPPILTYESVKDLTQTPTSRALSKDLKKHGWKFVGPTTCYAFMQATGLVNDHLIGCHTV